MRIAKSILAVVAVFPLVTAVAEVGVLKDPLQVQSLYINADGFLSEAPWLYVEFGSGSLPGCYNDQGAQLYKDDAMFKEMYSLLVTLIATGGIRGQVTYNIVDSGAGWGMCRTTAIVLRPAN